MTHPYASSAYAQAFGPAYESIYLPQAGTHALKRRIPHTEYADAMGCYPLSPLREAANLEDDFEILRAQGIISLVLITDPFFHQPEEKLQRSFDLMRPYKEHYFHDFSGDTAYSKHHRDRVRRAAKQVETRLIALEDHLDDWCRLYQELIDKRHIAGIQAFSRDYFTTLCRLNPVMIGGFSNGELVCAHLCLEHEGHVYSHLTASSEEGYRLRATYAVYDFTLRHFAEHGAKIMDLGGGAGVNEPSEGLTFFKKGFSNASGPCYLCGKILDREIYDRLSQHKKTDFFPAYRGSSAMA